MLPRKTALIMMLALAAPGCRHAPPLGRAGDITVAGGWAYPSVAGMAGAYLIFENQGGRADTVTALSGVGVGDASMHGVRREGVQSNMFPIAALEIPAKGRVAMRPGGIHIMMTELARELRMGDTVALRVDLAHGGRIEVRLPVLPYGEIPE